MGNTNYTNHGLQLQQNNTSRKHRLPNLRFSDWSLSNLADSLSINSFVSRSSHHTNYSTSRPWSRVSRRRWQNSTLNNPWEISKTAWPVSQNEALFLPDFKIQGDVSEKDFEVIASLKKGAFGRVFHIKKKDTGTEYAMKVLSKSKIIEEAGINQVKDEVKIQTMCGHNPFIAGCIFSWQNKKQLFIVSTYFEGGELFDLLQNYVILPEELVKLYVAEISLALDFLHNLGIIYRDLKLENILLDSDGHTHLIDFGLSKWLKYGCRTNTICGTLQYMAPEILNFSQPYGHAVDWWSLGVLACLLLTGKYPSATQQRLTLCIHGNNRSQNENNEMNSITSPLKDHQCSLAANDLLQRLLENDPQKRLKSLNFLKNISFFKGFNFSEARSKKVSPKELLKKYFPQGPPSHNANQILFEDF